MDKCIYQCLIPMWLQSIMELYPIFKMLGATCAESNVLRLFMNASKSLETEFARLISHVQINNSKRFMTLKMKSTTILENHQ